MCHAEQGPASPRRRACPAGHPPAHGGASEKEERPPAPPSLVVDRRQGLRPPPPQRSPIVALPDVDAARKVGGQQRITRITRIQRRLPYTATRDPSESV